MSKSYKVIFFGTEDFSVPSLQALIDANYQVQAVVTKPDTRRGRKSQLVKPAVKQLAEQHGITVLQPHKLSEIESELINLNVDVGVLVAYGKIIPQRILNLFTPHGIVNVHPSLLPAYRGPSPIESAILNGDSQTGVSLIKLVADMDAGPIYTQTKFKLNGHETRPELYKQLASVGADLLTVTLPNIVKSKVVPLPQQSSDATYTSLLNKDQSLVNPTTETAEQIERHVRAYQNFPKSKLILEQESVIITSAKVVTGPQANQLVVDCAKDSYLLIEKLTAPSGKTMSGEAYLRGYKID